MAELERSAPLEVRASGRTLTGEAVRYGQRATDRPERFEAGAFTPLGAVNLNLQHDPAIVLASTGDRLQVTDTDRALEVRAELRPGAALTLLERGSLRGLSVEFRALAERQQDGVRVIERARLEGIGLVDTPSYAGRLELRALSGRTLAAAIPTGVDLACDCAGDPQERFARLMSEGVAGVIDAAMAEVEKGILAAWQSYENPLASTAKGTLAPRPRRPRARRGDRPARQPSGPRRAGRPRRRWDRGAPPHRPARRYLDHRTGRRRRHRRGVLLVAGAGDHRVQHRPPPRLAHPNAARHRSSRGTPTPPEGLAMSTALPWPPQPGTKIPVTPDGDTGAVTLTAAQLAEATGLALTDAPAAVAERLLQVAARTVLDYAPEAPVALLNEAVIRFGGYLAQSDFGGVRSETLGSMSVEYVVNHAAAFRNCGAAALLTRHKRRRAGAI